MAIKGDEAATIHMSQISYYKTARNSKELEYLTAIVWDPSL